VKHLMSATLRYREKGHRKQFNFTWALITYVFERVFNGGRSSTGHLNLTNRGSYFSNFIECLRVFEINFLSASKSY
jgi:hypothetical protein